MTFNECIQYLKAHDAYLIITHLRPDGDTLGSAAALCHSLRLAGKTAYLWPNSEVTATYEDWVRPYFAPEGYIPETIISTDVASERLFPLGFTGSVEMAIDHHPTNSGFAPLLYCEPDSSSCGEIILKIVKELSGKPDRHLAELLYVAVATDTGCFVYGNTNAATHLAAAELFAAGIDASPLNKKLFRTFSFERLTLESMIYGGLQRYHNGDVNVAMITLDMMQRSGAGDNDCDDLAALAGRIEGSRVAVTIREIRPGESKVSLRCDAFFDSSAICARHGGGGHRMASGCTIYETPEKTRDIIVSEILEALA